MYTMRVLSVVRLSQLSDVTTSPERQREHVDKWVKVHDGVIVGQPEDLGVSGGLSPFERPNLGPWLTDDPPEPWDVLVAWRLDRVGRNALDVLLLLRWLEERDKRLVTVADGLDSAGPYAKAFITLAAVFAEMARTASLEMSADARAKLRADGKWVGGSIPHGYRVAENGLLEIDPKTAAEARKVLELAASKVSYAEIARRMGDGWYLQRVKRLVRNPAYVGLGQPPTPALVDPETFEAAQRPLKTQVRVGSAELSGVIVCLTCERPMWVRRLRRWGNEYRYYYCKEHGSGIRFDVIEELAIIEFVSAFGAEPVIDEIIHPDTSAAEAALCRVRLSALAAQLVDGDRDSLLTEMTSVSAELTALEGRVSSDRVERVDTGRTWAEEVDRLTLAELGDELRQRGYRIGVRKTSSRPEEIEVRALGL